MILFFMENRVQISEKERAAKFSAVKMGEYFKENDLVKLDEGIYAEVTAGYLIRGKGFKVNCENIVFRKK